MPEWSTLPAVKPGDRVAVLSPSWCAPEHFAAEHEQAMRRMRELLDVEPVEFATTRRQGTPAERAADINAAFADPSIRAIFATIGGEDQLTVIPHLDPVAAQANPKPFLGYSDNTNLLSWLWSLGVPSVDGGSTQVHLGPGREVNPLHLQGLRAALTGGAVALERPSRMSELGLRWGTPEALTGSCATYPTHEWTWAGRRRNVIGRTWGGNIEILSWVLGVSKWVPSPAELDGAVLLLESSEEVPSPEEIRRMLRVMGERGLLEPVAAVVWARPMVDAERPVPADLDAVEMKRAQYRDVVVAACERYAPDAVVVMDVDFGHTMPQLLLPYGEMLEVSGDSRSLVAHFERR